MTNLQTDTKEIIENVECNINNLTDVRLRSKELLTVLEVVFELHNTTVRMFESEGMFDGVPEWVVKSEFRTLIEAHSTIRLMEISPKNNILASFIKEYTSASAKAFDNLINSRGYDKYNRSVARLLSTVEKYAPRLQRVADRNDAYEIKQVEEIHDKAPKYLADLILEKLDEMLA